MLRTTLLLIVLAILATVGYLALTPPATPPPVASPRPTAAPVREQSVAPGGSTLTLDEATLNAHATSALAGQPIADTPFGPAVLDSLTLHLEEGRMRAEGNARAGPVSLPIAATFNVDVRDGRPRVAVQTAALGGIPLPDPALRALERAAQAPIDEALAEQRVRVDSVTLRPGSLTLVTTQ